MNNFIENLRDIGLEPDLFLVVAAVALLGIPLLAAISRFIFGRKSTLSYAISSAIGILFIYVLNILLPIFGEDFSQFITPLPFISMDEDTVLLFSFSQADYSVICSEIVSLLILAFLMNIADHFVPAGKNIFTWTLSKIVTVILAQAAHILIHWLTTAFLPEGIILYAPSILLAILILLIATGALKLIVGLFLATIHPVIGALYTFFFASLIGKMVTKAVLTTGLLCGLVYLMEAIQISSICIAMGALSAYIPFLICLAVCWYLVNKIITK